MGGEREGEEGGGYAEVWRGVERRFGELNDCARCILDPPFSLRLESDIMLCVQSRQSGIDLVSLDRHYH